MCSGPKKPSSPPPTGGVDAKKQPSAAVASLLLLELAAADDLPSFKRAVEEHNLPLDVPAPWYSRSPTTNIMGLHHRTPLHVAALYGSTSVLTHLLSSLPSSAATSPSPSDSATPLLLAAPSAVPLLLAAAAGNRPSSPQEKQQREYAYPLDATLPDIKSGIYGTDEFRMYTFKVKPCSRAYSHDWTECPFVHPGENARRRDPRKYVYSCVPCPEFRKGGSCRHGNDCEYAHGVFESWLHPAQYRTRLCKDEIGCSRRVCFFAHKREELRIVDHMDASLAAVAQSPRSSSIGDTAAALLMMQAGSTSPSSSGMGTSPVWMNQPPALQLPSSSLKASLNARNIDFDLGLVGMEGYQQKLINELATATTSSPRSNLRTATTAASRGSHYTDLLGSLDPAMLFQLQQGQHSIKHMRTSAAQFLSRTGIQRQLHSGYGGNMPSTPAMRASCSIGLDRSTANGIMSSRATAFANRSQSFIDRGAVGRLAAASASAVTTGLSDWGSPSGKLDWGIQGEELNKLRKSASFGLRSSRIASNAAALDEPDLSWVHSLVKDGPAAPMGQLQKKQYQLNGSSGRDHLDLDMLSVWAEQEMVA